MYVLGQVASNKVIRRPSCDGWREALFQNPISVGRKKSISFSLFFFSFFSLGSLTQNKFQCMYINMILGHYPYQHRSIISFIDREREREREREKSRNLKVK